MQIKVCHHYLKTVYSHINVQIPLITEIYSLFLKNKATSRKNSEIFL